MTASSRAGPDPSAELERFREQYRLPECQPGDRLDALGFDSLGFLELLVYVEDRSGRQLDEATFRTLTTVDDIVRFITQP